MDPMLSHAISTFRIMFIPDILLKHVPPFISSLVISLLPVTPINMIIFLLLLTLIYATNMMNMTKKEEYTCRGSTLVKNTRFSFWSLIKNTYYFYLLIAYAVNLLTLTDFQMLNLNAIRPMT
jgi:hypothetical protein